MSNDGGVGEGTSGADIDVTSTSASRTNGELEDRLRGRTFAMGKLAGSNDMGGGDEEGGILAKKHRRAMEEFIRENLRGEGGVDAVDGGGDESEEGKVEVGAVVRASEAAKELYAELLTSIDDGKGGTIDNKTMGGEGDVGAGGAMMGGTGIAEVALPIDERLRALKATEKAAIEHERARRARFGDGGSKYGVMLSSSSSSRAGESRTIHSTSIAAMVPMNFAPGPGKRKRRDLSSMQSTVEDPSLRASLGETRAHEIGFDYPVESSAMVGQGSYSPVFRKSDLSQLGASYSHNFQLHTKEWVMRRRDERQNEIDTMQAKQEVDEGPTTEEGRARVGFDMSRKLARGDVIAPSVSAVGGKGSIEEPKNEWDRKPGGDHRSSDERVWRTFMTNQRNRR
ncbi:hypothetical protein ACHAXA_001529 [Cyclostephanos tholiformis]|uniref:Uncharacterized protein n=1 Tax=Cyclostephanos tholiformis TaxID=382380 RepID=A0ABD3RX84_9STRA